MLKKSNNGISLITLVIVVIVMIILAAIVIFTGLNTPDQAVLAKFATDIDNVQTATDSAYYKKYTDVALKGDVWTEAQIYEYVASGVDDKSQLIGTGITAIDEKNNLLNMKLPIYENCRWGLALEDINSYIHKGDVVLVPGLKLNERTYSSKGDISVKSDITEDDTNDNEEIVFTNPYSLTTYIQDDKIQVGHYVKYVPTSSSIHIMSGETGMEFDQDLTTANNTTWRIINIDKEKNTISIAPTFVVNKDALYLGGLIGYNNITSVLHRTCKELYSNSSLGVTARSMTENDIRKACNYTTTVTNRYAIYPYGTPISGKERYNGNEYTQVAHAKSPNALPRIYGAESGEIPYTDDDGYTYFVPTADRPVYLTEHFFTLNPSSLNSTFATILTGDYGWVAEGESMFYRTGSNQCCMVSGRVLWNNRYAGCGFFNSVNAAYDHMNCGLRPVVEFNTKHSIDRNYLSNDGSAEKPWVFTN